MVIILPITLHQGGPRGVRKVLLCLDGNEGSTSV
jgi:hypothetical protein